MALELLKKLNGYEEVMCPQISDFVR